MEAFDLSQIAAFIAAVSPMIYSVLVFASNISAKNWNGVIKQSLAYAGGIGFAFLLGASDFAASLHIDKLNAASLVIAGFLAGSSTTVGDKLIKAIDNSQSAATPPIVK